MGLLENLRVADAERFGRHTYVSRTDPFILHGVVGVFIHKRPTS